MATTTKITQDQVVIITGASSGIGEELAYQLSKKGYKLVLAARNEGQLQTVADHCKELGAADVAIKPTDVSQEKQCKALIEFALKRFETLDMLILNAGVACHQPFQETDIATFQTLMQVNFFGYLYCTKYALPYLKNTKGTIVVIGSVSGEMGLPLRSAYCASKFAVTGFFESLQTELGDQVQITIVQPAFVKTNIRENAYGPKGQDIEHNEAKRMSVEECARRVLDAANSRRRKVILTTAANLGVAFKPVFPGLVQRLANRKTNATIAPAKL